MNLRANVVSVAAALTQELRLQILSGALAPGTALSEVDLATRYEVSRPTARSALDSLVGARLMRRGAHKTARVTTLSPEDVDDIYHTRYLIEAGAARHLASQRTVPTSARIANDEIMALTEASPLDIIRPDIDFHRSLVDALRSERASLAYALLADEMELCMAHVQDARLFNTEAIASDHEGILAAIAAGNPTLADSILENHLDRARVRLRAHLQTN